MKVYVLQRKYGIIMDVSATLTANYEYSRRNRENLQLPIQIKLSKKPSIFCRIFFEFLEFTLHFQCAVAKISLIGQVFLNLLTPKDVFI